MDRSTSPQFRHHEQCELLDSAVRSQLAETPQWGRRRQFKAGSFVWMEHDRANRIFLLESGRVRVSCGDEDGHETEIRIVHPGEMFGELCFCPYSAIPHGMRARAITTARAIETKIGAGQVGDSLLRDVDFSAKLIETFCARLSDAESRLRILAIRDGRSRIEQGLLHFAGRRGAKEGAGGRLSFTVSHAELAAFTAMTRPHTTVLLTRLRGEGVIQYGRASSMKLDPKKISSAKTAKPAGKKP